MIDLVTKDKILDAANIMEVVSEFVTLRKRGVNYVGLCPFHADSAPSFYVSPSRNICKCFACGEGGSPVSFIMKHEQLSYHDALLYLAKKYHIEVHEKELTDEEKQAQSDRESMFIVNNWAQKHFTSRLYEHEEGRTIGLRYFMERGFREDIIRKFQLGYSLEQRDDLYREATKNGYKKEFLEKTGLVLFHENGSASDRFRGRVLFPVHTLSGKVVAFGGRILKKNEKTAKYVNSPESDIYHKGRELYGVYLARQSIAKADKCFLVEGYTDVISMYQSGVENVVASSGTALTQGQINLIHRMTDNITVIYDGDAAGIKAAIRGIDLLLEEGMNVKVVLLPEGEDPDSFARSHNATELTNYISTNEVDFIRFKTNLLLQEVGDDPVKRASLVSDIIRTVSVIPDNIKRAFYVKECSDLMDIKEQTLISALNKVRAERPKKQPAVPAAQKGGAQLESELQAKETQPVNSDKTDETPDMPPDEEIIRIEAARRTVSPFKPFEEALLRYVVQFGERILFEDVDEGRRQVTRVAEYILAELQQDGFAFHTPEYKALLDEAVLRCHEEGFSAFRHFLSHPDPGINRMAISLLDERYQIQYEEKTDPPESLTERDRMEWEREQYERKHAFEQLIRRDLFALKNAHINHKIETIIRDIKRLQRDGKIEEAIGLMKELEQFNRIKSFLSNELGERVIPKM
ncbi:MAG: DNA primase [Tannerella sp.]|jgi:DNA primase|nr:DNA primase [Tannerella sp.]